MRKQAQNPQPGFHLWSDPQLHFWSLGFYRSEFELCLVEKSHGARILQLHP